VHTEENGHMNHWHFICEGERSGPILWTEQDRDEIADYFHRNFPLKRYWYMETCEDVECLLESLSQ
jgi:hypothetical protein